MHGGNKVNIRRIIYIALLSGLSIVLTRVLSLRIPVGGIEGVRIGFGPLPIIIAGFLFSPVDGAICGIISDIIGYFINPIGPYVPVFTIISMLRGLLPGLICIRRKDLSFVDYLLAIMISQITTSIILTPLSLKLIFGIPLEPILIPAIISQAILIPLYSFLTMTIVSALRRFISNETC